jgi:metal-responsive CopG/Arc/MetJ family transcriptional regulator
MKTAISLPDDLFESADALAKRLGVSRSELYATAVAEFLAKHQHAKVTERLDQVYGQQPSRLAPPLRRAQGRSLRPPAW